MTLDPCSQIPDAQEPPQNADNNADPRNNGVQPQAVAVATSPLPATAQIQPAAVILQIEVIFESIAYAIQEGTEPSIPYRRVRSKNANNWHRFPGRSVSEARTFARVLRILEMSHQALKAGNTVTKRNIFYQDKELFCDQSTVDRLVDDIAFTLGVGRHSLNITAASKGLIVGPISFVLGDGSVISCDSMQNEGTLISSMEGIRQINFPTAHWILIIEKEATFSTLASSQFFRNSRAGPGVMITGKGYPDLSTRKLIHRLRTERPDIPVHGLVDYDPDGIRILRTYKFGSTSLQHETDLVVNSVRWIGIRSSDVKQYHLGLRKNLLENTGFEYIKGLRASQPDQGLTSQKAAAFPQNGKGSGQLRGQPASSMSRKNAFEANTSLLTSRDRKLAQEMLVKLSSPTGDGREQGEYVKELQVMLMLNIKAEIQSVDNLGDVTRWLDDQLSSHGMQA